MVRALSRAAVLSPGDVCARFRLGQSLAAQGQELRAIQEWRAADAVEFFLTYGQALSDERDHAGAVVQYERALAIAPDMPEAYYYLGRALAALGQKEEALIALERAVAREPLSSPKRYLVQSEINVAREEWGAAFFRMSLLDYRRNKLKRKVIKELARFYVYYVNVTSSFYTPSFVLTILLLIVIARHTRQSSRKIFHSYRGNVYGQGDVFFVFL